MAKTSVEGFLPMTDVKAQPIPPFARRLCLDGPVLSPIRLATSFSLPKQCRVRVASIRLGLFLYRVAFLVEGNSPGCVLHL